MGWQRTVLSVPMLLALGSSVVLLGFVVTTYRDRLRDPIVQLYVWTIVAAIVWSGFSALKLLQTDPATKLLFYRLLHVGAAALPPLMFLFVTAFTDRNRWLRADRVGAVFLVPTAFLVLLFVDPGGLVVTGTHLVETDLVILRVGDGPGFLLFLVYSALLVAATLGIVLVELRRVGAAYYPQALLIALAVSTPIAFAVLTAAGVPPFADDRVNLVPTSAAVSVGAFGLLLYRYRLVDLPPLAYATAMKYTPDALFVLDREGTVISTNDHARDLLDHLGGRVGSRLADALPAFDPETVADELVEITHPSGEVTYHRVFVEPLGRGGTRLGWVVVFRDETDQQRQQERLQRKTEQMELFATTVSHDLRNPLSVARGNLELAREEFDSEELDRVESAHARMAEIIDDVLMLARAGKRIDTLEAVEIGAVVRRAWENVTTATADLSVAVDGTVMADPSMIQHVFENLFRNAVEHGGNDVTVTVGSLDDGIYVEDDGEGLPPDARDGLFDATDGEGFGLRIIEQIVTAHGWEIHATAGTEGGARFEITGPDVVEETH